MHYFKVASGKSEQMLNRLLRLFSNTPVNICDSGLIFAEKKLCGLVTFERRCLTDSDTPNWRR